MREIKLRAWDKVHEEMIEWEKYKDELVSQDFTDNNLVIMQYTGLKDKNGVEIYEGDILINKSTINQPAGQITTKIIGDIQILNGMTYLIGKTWQDVDGEDIRLSEYKSLMLSPELFKIIGNIYENPEIRDNN